MQLFKHKKAIKDHPLHCRLSNVIFSSFSSESAQSRSRIFRDSLDHHDKVAPLHRITFRGLVILRYLESACFKAFNIHHHPAVFGMKQFHQSAVAPDEDEDVTVADIGTHMFLNDSDKRVDSLAHVGPPRTQVIAHRVIEAEHGSYF